MEEYDYIEKNASIGIEKTASGKFVFKIRIPFNVENDENPVLDRIKKIYDKLEETYNG